MTVTESVLRTFGKLLRGRPHSRAPLADIGNVMAAFAALTGRKLGIESPAAIRLGYGPRRHTWRIRRREDLMVLEEVFLDEDYDMAIPAPSVIFDLGAASIYFALRWPDAQIVAVEPSPALFPDLVDNTRPYPNIRCLNYAAGAEDGVLPFTVSSNSVGGRLSTTEDNEETVEVETRSLRSLMKECDVSHIDLLKFDIEGAESRLFRDPAGLQQVKAFVGEIHPEFMDVPTETFLQSFSEFDTQRQDLPFGFFLLRGTRPAA